jgi:hypothetical protein
MRLGDRFVLGSRPRTTLRLDREAGEVVIEQDSNRSDPAPVCLDRRDVLRVALVLLRFWARSIFCRH